VQNCTLRDSVVDSESRVENVDLNGALVGAHTRLNGSE
jgi:hypothetical protein